MAEWVKVAQTADLRPGMALAVAAGGLEIALFNIGGKVYALDNACQHQGGPLAEGTLEAGVVTCPWHGWQYDVATGAVIGDPSMVQTTYPVEIRGGDIYLQIP